MMKKWLLTASLLIGLLGVGCMPLRVQEQHKVPQTQLAEKPRPVMAEDVKEQNAHEMARLLNAEIQNEK
jgi:hypothetical protein